MKIAEKKLGFFMGTVRQNFMDSKIVGTIEGEVTKLKGGRRMVSFDKEGNLVFWIVNDFDITVCAEDIVDCKIAGFGRRGAPMGSGSSSRGAWYGPAFDLTFVDGTKGCLVVNEFGVDGAEYRDSSVAEIPIVEGWLTSDGRRDEHYNDEICPEGYKANIVGYSRSVYGNGKLSKVIKSLKLNENFSELFGSDGSPKGMFIFDGSKSTYFIKKAKK